MCGLWIGVKLHVATFFGIIIRVTLLVSLWLFALTDPGSCEFVSTQDAIKSGWTEYCWSCDSYRPTGAAHCHACQRCILNQSHHFGLGVNCVGANTIHYYSIFFVSLFVASLYANFVRILYGFALTMKFDASLAFSIFVPLLAWAFDIVDEDFGVVLNAMVIQLTLFYSFVQL